MDLLTKQITVIWNSKNKRYYEKKGYIFSKYGDSFSINVEDILKKSNAKVDIVCNVCGAVKNVSFNYYYKHLKNNSDCGCISQFTKLHNPKISFQQWCLNHSREDILLRWDYDKNGCSPNTICYAENLKFWFKCLECEEHESEEFNISDFTKGGNRNISCRQCNLLFYKSPDLVKYFVNIDDAKNNTFSSHKKFDMRCPICGYVKKMSINTLSQQGFSCPRCSDGVSYPNKFFFEFISQLNINFIPEYSAPWTNNRRYDFYFKLNDKEYVVEMDGGFHGKDNKMNGMTREESIRIDEEKNKLAEDNNVEMIRINSEKSNMTHIKKYILKSKLNKLFNLSLINWVQCSEYALNSMVGVVCNLWNELSDISKVIKQSRLSNATVRKYLKQGNEVGLCKYNPRIYKTYQRKEITYGL